jgi:hypothetical protein
MNRLILILSLGVLMLAFQNCAKPGLQDTAEVCTDCESDPNLNSKSSPIPSESLQLFVGEEQLGGRGGSGDRGDSSEAADGYSHRIEVVTDLLFARGQRAGCDISRNSNWRELKNLLSQNGLCKYTYELPPENARCMALAIPFAVARNSTGDDPLSGSICGNSHTTICGRENFDNFTTLFRRLLQDLQAGALCE